MIFIIVNFFMISPPPFHWSIIMTSYLCTCKIDPQSRYMYWSLYLYIIHVEWGQTIDKRGLFKPWHRLGMHMFCLCNMWIAKVVSVVSCYHYPHDYYNFPFLLRSWHLNPHFPTLIASQTLNPTLPPDLLVPDLVYSPKCCLKCNPYQR